MLKRSALPRLGLLALPVLFALALNTPLSAQTCTVTRDQVANDLASGLTTDQVQAKYAGCTASTQSGSTPTAPVPAQATLQPQPSSPPTEVVTNTGSTAYESILSCGYQPQSRMGACTVEIRQPVGFGGKPCVALGSHEYTLLCVDYKDGNGLTPVNTNGFHIHDEAFGAPPRWYFAAIVQSNARLLGVATDGQTYVARMILSWNLPPTG